MDIEEKNLDIAKSNFAMAMDQIRDHESENHALADYIVNAIYTARAYGARAVRVVLLILDMCI